ncbi:hypothetical protein JCM8097_005588 [Rhodosporidiobolus ruineniae]
MASPTRPSPPASGPTLSFVSSDLNVAVSGRLVSQNEPRTVEGIVLELDERGVQVKHPALVSIQTKPESQTLWSINTGEALLTLATPLIPPSDEEDDTAVESEASEDDAAVEEDDDDVDDLSLASPAAPALKDKTDKPPTKTKREKKPRKPTLVTLHGSLLPSSSSEELESSALFSTTFRILIDGPSFPLPHFDPSSIVPPTPSVKPYTFDPSNPPARASEAAFAGGVLNSPTLQRALLSPLLSPQRRASSLAGSDASIPPLNLGLSRTSRPSFSGAERPRKGSIAPGKNGEERKLHGLAALIPALNPSANSSLSSSSGVTATPSFSAVDTSSSSSSSSSSSASIVGLHSTLTLSLSTAAKKTAEEILSLRRAHDLFVRRAKAELEVLEARIEDFRANGPGGGEEGVVRGFRTKEDRERAKAEREKERSERSQSRGTSQARRSTSRDSPGGSGRSQDRDPDRGRGRPGFGAVAEASSAASAHTLKATDRDESLSLRMREADEREEDERGRSRSRIRRGGMADAERRSKSRTKGVAEATRRAVEGAREKSASRERSAEGADEVRDGRGRGRKPREGENIPATVQEGDETEGTTMTERESRGRAPTASASSSSSAGAEPAAASSFLSPPALQPLPSSSSSGPSPSHRPSDRGGATPTFIPSSSKALVSVPEEEELSLPPSRAESRTRIDRTSEEREREGRRRERTETGETVDLGDEETDQPFEMDEDVDVDVDELDLASPKHRPTRSPAALDLEGDSSTAAAPSTASPQQPVSSSFKPGSFQRASALSASYAALLSTSASHPGRGSPVSPSVSALSALGSPATASRQADGLPPFSPPDAKTPVTTSAREDAQNALAASILERTSGAGTENGRSKTPGPDPRLVRRGEQKIRDVLAMDVPSHRPRVGGRRASVSASTMRYAPDEDSADEEDNNDEGADTVDDLNASIASLRSPGAGGSSSKFQVGSLPIALGRPSTVNAALSSWRPDPERLWKENQRRGSGGATGVGAVGAGSYVSAPQPFKAAADSQAAAPSPIVGTAPPAAGWTGSTQPVQIGSPAATSTRRASVAGGGGGAAASSLAQSLRAAPASFSARAEAERRFERGVNGRREEEQAGVAEDGAEEEDDDDEDEDDGTFVPPHMVAERRARKDEQWLSRSISRS